MLESAYRVLDRVYRDGAFVGQALNEVLNELPPEKRASVTQLTYGVLERDATLKYYIDTLCARPPKAAIRVLLRIGFYLLLYSDTPDYAAVNGTVELTRRVGKGAQSGFVNAVLKQWEQVPVPTGEEEKLSFYTGKPLWFVREILHDYPEEGRGILTAEPTRRTHVRGAVKNNTPYGAYVDGSKLGRLDPERTAIMGLGSCAIASAVEARDGEEILDVCAAPGGKSVYLAQQADCRVTACDIHPHRVALVEKYAARMGVSDRVRAVTADATALGAEFDRRFDRVLADVPCSGSGVVYSKPDILLRQPDFESLNAVQNAILERAGGCVKDGGRVVYSTCSVFRRENDGVVRGFLSAHPEFAVKEVVPKIGFLKTDYGIQLLPTRSETEGFYYAVLQRRGSER